MAGALLPPRGLSSLATTLWGVLIGTVVLAPLAVGLFAGGGIPQADATSWAAVVFLALVTSILGYVGWYWALDRGGIGRIATLQFLQPVSGFVLAAIVLGEHVTAPIAVGSALIVGGIVIAQRRVSRRLPAMPSSIPDRVLVVGLARSGRAAIAALQRAGKEVVAYDRDESITLEDLDVLELALGEWDTASLSGVGLLVKSPGVPETAPPRGGRPGVPVISEIELGARLLSNPILGITGTNGKTTTTALLGAMFAAAGVPAEVAGNIGRPLTSLVGTDPGAWVVCELSSFQLEDVESLRPRIAVLLNLEPDHLDRHGSFEAYRDAKLRIFENQQATDVAVVPRGFAPVPGRARRTEFAGDDPLPAEPRIPGAHNRENAAAATAAARAAGIGDGRSPRRCWHSPVSSTGSRSSRRSPECATSTTRRRRTSRRRSARSPRFPAPGCTSFSGASGRSESYDAARPGVRARTIVPT